MATSVTTTVDCHKQVRSWRLLRSLIQLLIPTCNCTTILDQDHQQDATTISNKTLQNSNYLHSSSRTCTTITGTIFGYRKSGKVSFCIQSNTNSTNPILLLELAVPTSILAREMRKGSLRIALESNSSGGTLLSTPLWTMYCNGKKVGYAVKRRPLKCDVEALSLMRSVVVGTGVMKCNGEREEEEEEEDRQVTYLRANFQRVRASSECESFHLIDPEGDIHQELSIFFFRSM